MNHENLSNDQEISQNPWNLPDTEEEKTIVSPDRIGKIVMRVLNRTKFTDIRKDPEKFEEFIQSLDTETAMDFLKRLNGMLRSANFKDRGYAPGMQVNSHIAPDPEVQNINYASALEAIKQIDNPRHRAALAFYTINNQHTFHDGNGRTSRAIFEIFNNSNFNLDQPSYQHQEGEKVGNREEFGQEQRLHGAETANRIVNKILASNLAHEGKIDPRINEAERFSIPGIVGNAPDVYFTPESKSVLDEDQRNYISHAFTDKDIAKLALCEVLQEKGTATNVITENTFIQPSYTVINIAIDQSDDPELSEHTFSGWTAKDYVKFMRNFRRTQVQTQQIFNDIFLHPENYPLSDESVRDAIRSGVINGSPAQRPTHDNLSDDQTLADWLISTR